MINEKDLLALLKKHTGKDFIIYHYCGEDLNLNTVTKGSYYDCPICTQDAGGFLYFESEQAYDEYNKRRDALISRKGDPNDFTVYDAHFCKTKLRNYASVICSCYSNSRNDIYFDSETSYNECAEKIKATLPKPVMPNKVTYDDVFNYAKEKDKDLLCNDYKGAVNIIHQDGSTFHFNYAFYEDYDRYLIVFTEHHQFQIFYKDDLTEYSEWTRKQLTFDEE